MGAVIKLHVAPLAYLRKGLSKVHIFLLSPLGLH